MSSARLHGLRGDVRVHGDACVPDCRPVKTLLQPLLCARHERRMKGPADDKFLHDAGAPRLCNLHPLRTPATEPEITTCPGELKFAGLDDPCRRSFPAHLVDDPGGKPDHCRHRSRMLLSRPLHEFSPETHKAQCVLERKRACGDERGVLSQGVTGDERRLPADKGEQRHAVKKNRRLRVFGLPEFLFRPVETEVLRGNPRIASACSKSARAPGCADAMSFPIPTYCDPCPGKTYAVTAAASAGIL